ncbi:hypothetical protein [Corynebacterium singulare]|uniref:Uncharacterized protein n=2 Tax=Corynebacterium singulare TaxID=161899 RepID=A0ABS9PU61_9CORY|nr:hypothetical protein [Corynebacterium singulare]MCG7276212.1 hypothetical protein [Corynebacterium singulare]
MTHRRTSARPLLNRKRIPMVAVAAAITSLGIFISDQLPKPRDVEFASFEYADEIPGHTRISDVMASVRELEPGEYAEYTGSTASDAEELYEATVHFTVERTRTYVLSVKLEDAEGRVFRTGFPQCNAEVLSQPVDCTSIFILPEGSLGAATFEVEVENLAGDGFHEQPVPMSKEIHSDVEVSL